MDYLDQLFDPAAYSDRHAARPSPVAHLEQPAQEPKAPVLPQREPPATAAPEPVPPASEAVDQASGMPEGDRDQWVRSTVRLHPWLALNWAQLTAAQQQRIERQLANAGTGTLMAGSEPASAWDTMGLDDRTDLAFGSPSTPALAGAATNRDAGYATRRR